MIFSSTKDFITFELANKLVRAAILHANTLDVSIAVAITDSTGNLVAFGRMDGCCLIGIGTAQGKAYTAARSGLNTREFLAYLQENNVCLNSLKNENLVLIAGGLPIIYRDQELYHFFKIYTPCRDYDLYPT